MDRLQDVMPATLKFGETIKVHGLGVLPILNEACLDIIPPLITTEEALESGALSIREVDEAGSVSFLHIENSGDKPVLILDGEELVGGLQNRIINTSVIVLAHHSVRACVSCIQAKRWSGSGDFQSAKSIFRASSRSIQKKGVTENLRRCGMPVSDQGAVWDSVEKSLQEHHVNSKTADFQDVRHRVFHQVEEFVETIQPFPGQVGAVFFSRRGIVGMEYLHSADLFARCIAKVVRSFCFEVLMSPSLNGTSPDPAKAWWAEMLQCPFTEHNSVGVGDDIRTEADNLVGSGLMYGRVVIHFSGFPDFRDKEKQPNGSRLSARDRRRNLRTS